MHIVSGLPTTGDGVIRALSCVTLTCRHISIVRNGAFGNILAKVVGQAYSDPCDMLRAHKAIVY